MTVYTHNFLVIQYSLQTNLCTCLGFQTGIRDSSGMRLTYTPTLRADDASVFSIGFVYGIFVPPETDNFKMVAYCHSSCTKQVSL